MPVQELGQVDGILSFWELSQPLVSRLAERLGLPANPPAAVDAAREKQVGNLPCRLDCPLCVLVCMCISKNHCACKVSPRAVVCAPGCCAAFRMVIARPLAVECDLRWAALE